MNGVGEDFKLLGITFAVELRMGRGVSTLAREAGWRLFCIIFDDAPSQLVVLFLFAFSALQKQA